jgi:hypothetical protein
MRVRRFVSYILCILIIIAIIALCGCKEKEEEKQVFENGMDAGQNMGFAISFYLECNQKYVFALDVTKELEFYPTKNTEMLIAVLNYEVWDHVYTLKNQMEKTDEELIELYGEGYTKEYFAKRLNGLNEMQAEARAVCEKYGITNENRLTVKWVLENQYDAFYLYCELPSPITGTARSLYKELYEGYNLGGKESDPQPNTEE